MGELLDFFRRPVVIDFTHIVCKPGDVVCISVPDGLPEGTLKQVIEVAKQFHADTAVKLCVFADGIQLNGEAQ